MISPNNPYLLNLTIDIIGNIAVLEIGDTFKQKEGFIAEELLKIQPIIKTVVKK